jgi:lysophospholipase L1-like esterase
MKRRTLLFSLLIAVIIFSIYTNKKDNKIFYLSLGDSLSGGVTPYGNRDYGYSDYIKDHLIEKGFLEKYVNYNQLGSYRITDLINDINNNKELIINNEIKTLKNVLVKADIITISIGENDLLYRLTLESTENLYKYANEIIRDIENLLKIIRTYSKEQIFLVGYYQPLFLNDDNEIVELFVYLNDHLDTLSNNYNINYIRLNTLFYGNKTYLPNPLDIHPSKRGYEVIANEIIREIKK